MTEYIAYKGDVIKFTVAYDGYNNKQFSLLVALRGTAGTYDGTATADILTDGYNVAIPTASLDAGTYNGYCYITGNDNNRILLDQFTLTVNADFLTSTTTTDNKSFARQALAVIEKQILACGSNGYISINTDGRSITRITLTELMDKRDKLLTEIETEEQDDRTKAGQQTRKPTFIVFR